MDLEASMAELSAAAKTIQIDAAPLPVGRTTHPWVGAADRSPAAQATRSGHRRYIKNFSTRASDAKYAQVQSRLHNSSERAIRCVSRCSAAEPDLIRNKVACDTC